MFEIYVRPFPASGARVQVSGAGGTEALWGRSGRSLYYRGPNGDVVDVVVTTHPEFSIAERKAVLSGEYLTDSSHPNYDVAPDGRFMMLKRSGADAQRSWCTTGGQSCARRRGRNSVTGSFWRHG